MKKALLVIFILAVTSISYISLFQKGFYYAHDDVQIRRIEETYNELRYKTFPVRWLSGLAYGYGYPILNFYSPLPYHLGATLMMAHLDAITATKILIILGFVIGAISMFLLGKELFGSVGGLISSIFFTFAPFHSIEIYVRGSLPEFLAMSFLPLVFYSFLMQAKENKFKYLILSMVSLSLIILSHHVLALLLLPILLPYLTLLIKIYPKSKTPLAQAFVLGFTLSSFFWLPAFVESSLTRAPMLESFLFQSYKGYFLPLSELLNRAWSYDGFNIKGVSSMSFEIGKLHLLLIPISIFIFFKKADKKTSLFILFLIVSFFYTIFMTTSASQFLWETIPYFINTHFPWRYLAISAFLASLLAGSITLVLKSNSKKFIASLVLIVILLGLEAYKFQPKKMEANYKPSITDIQDTTTWEYQYLPIWIQKPQEKQAANKLEVLTSSVKVDNVTPWHLDYSFDAEAAGFAKMKFSSYYFPGWNVYVDNSPITIDFVENQGLITFQAPPGKHRVQVKFEDSPIRKIGNILSLLTLLSLPVLKYIDSIKRAKITIIS